MQSDCSGRYNNLTASNSTLYRQRLDAPGEMMSAPKISLVLLSVLLPAVSCSRFKIAIPAESSAESARDSFAKRAGGGCSDFVRVQNPGSLNFPDGFQHLQRPWIDNYRAYAGTSETVTYGINHLFTLKVPGLEGQTIMEVIGILKRNGCLSFPFGGAVRDQFLGLIPQDLDMESNCDADTLYRICKQNWDQRFSNCRRRNHCLRGQQVANYVADDFCLARHYLKCC